MFEGLYSRIPSKTNTFDLISKLTKIYETESPSTEEIAFSAHLFSSEYLIKKFFRQNFVLFDLEEKKVGNSSISYIDMETYFSFLLKKESIVSALEYFSPRKHYLDSIFDGNFFEYSPNTLHLALYIDDFDPLIKSVYCNPSSHKATGFYVKILNLPIRLG